MKNLRVLAILIFAIALIVGCSSSSYCVKVDGSSDKYGIDNAGVEFCYNPAMSEKEQASVFSSAKNGDEYYLVHRKYIERANDIIASSMKAKATSAPSEKQLTMQKFIGLLK